MIWVFVFEKAVDMNEKLLAQAVLFTIIIFVVIIILVVIKC